mgnify:FL=1
MLLSELPPRRRGDGLGAAVSRLLNCFRDNLGERLRELRLRCLLRDSFGDNLLLLFEKSTPLFGKNNVDVKTASEDVRYDVIGGDVIGSDVIDGDVIDGRVIDGDIIDGDVIDGDVMWSEVPVTVIIGGNFMDDVFWADAMVVIVTDVTAGNVIVTAVTFADATVTDAIVTDVTVDDDIVGDDITCSDVRLCGVTDGNEVG